jgi:FkbM family methyltransferase
MDSEQATHQHLAELFARIRPECVLDVGANAGQYGERLREHGYRGWIVSFEPVRAVFEDLAERAARDERWRVLNFALGAAHERRRIGVANVSQLSSFRQANAYALSEFPGESEVTRAEEVEIRTLDECWLEALSGLPQERVYLKLDTQGWDLEVLKGAGASVGKLVGLQLEASVLPIYDQLPTFTETIDTVRRLGFDLTGIYAVSEDSLSRLIEVDCVFINPHHPDAGQWREDTWAILGDRFRHEVSVGLPSGVRFVLIDDASLGIEELDGRPAIPFLERDGEYHGAPENGEEAVAELARQVQAGVRHVVIAWPSFWMLEEYPELAQQLESSWRRLTDTDAALVYELDAAPPPAPTATR